MAAELAHVPWAFPSALDHRELVHAFFLQHLPFNKRFLILTYFPVVSGMHSWYQTLDASRMRLLANMNFPEADKFLQALTQSSARHCQQEVQKAHGRVQHQTYHCQVDKHWNASFTVSVDACLVESQMLPSPLINSLVVF